MNQPSTTREKAPQVTTQAVPLVGSITAKNQNKVNAITNVTGISLVGSVTHEDDGVVNAVTITDAAALAEVTRILNLSPAQREKKLQEGSLSFEEEVVVHEKDRPSFIVQAGALKGVTGEWASKLNAAQAWLPRAIHAVGRIDDRQGHLATGFLVLPDVVVTNRHVAEDMVRKQGGKYTLKDGLSINFVDGDDPVIRFAEVIYYDEAEALDLALFKLERAAGGRKPLHSSTALNPAADTLVAVIGFPARPHKLTPERRARVEQVFGNVYSVKRVAVGKVFEPPQALEAPGWSFPHDASTLSGNSGSLVADLSTGEALGVHFGGWPDDSSNLAVYFHEVKRLLEQHVGRETA